MVAPAKPIHRSSIPTAPLRGTGKLLGAILGAAERMDSEKRQVPTAEEWATIVAAARPVSAELNADGGS